MKDKIKSIIFLIKNQWKKNKKSKVERPNKKKSYIQIRIEGLISKQIKLNKRSKNQKIKNKSMDSKTPTKTRDDFRRNETIKRMRTK